MKVYIVTKEGFPHGMAATKRIMNYAKLWISQGIDCEILIYTRTERYGKAPKNIIGKGIYEGVPFRYMKLTPIRESNVIIRRTNDYLDRLRLKKYLLRNLKKGDVVYAYNGCDGYSYDILQIAHYKGAAYAVELCELPFGTSEENPKKVRQRKAYEKGLLPYVDGVITISDALTEYAKAHCSPQAHVAKIPILVDYSKYAMENRSEEPQIPFLFHSGTLYQQKDGFLDMLRAFAIAAKQLPFDVHFISTGTPKGSRHEKEIHQIIEEYEIKDRVTFTGYLSDTELRDYLSKAAFVVINKLTTKQNKYCFSTKLGEYMAAQKAVIITRVGEAMNYLTHEHDAYIIEPNDIQALVNAIKKMFSDKKLRHTLGVNAQNCVAEKFSLTSNSMKLKMLINVIGGGKKWLVPFTCQLPYYIATNACRSHGVTDCFHWIANKLRRIPFKLLSVSGHLLSDKTYLTCLYYLHSGRIMRWNNPHTFNEKLQWLKLNYRKPIMTIMVDKVKAKEYVADILGKQYLIPTLGVWTDADLIDFNSLPEKFVIKCNHNSGLGMYICNNRTEMDTEKIRRELHKGMAENYYLHGREWPYRDVPRRIIAEQFMTDESGTELKDYKIFCFNGEPYIIEVDLDRFTNHRRNIYTTNWELLNAQIEYPSDITHSTARPQKLDEMLNLARKLSAGFPHMRTDFYIINEQIYFGEMTFFHGSGFEHFYPEDFNRTLGNYIGLSTKYQN